MKADDDDAPSKGLRKWWASPPRSGMRRLIASWEYRHLRTWAGVRLAIGTVAVGLGVVILSFGGADSKTYWWTIVFLAIGAAHFAVAFWELTMARSSSRRD